MQLVPLHAATKDTIYFTPYKNNVFFNSYFRYEFDRYPKKGVGIQGNFTTGRKVVCV